MDLWSKLTSIFGTKSTIVDSATGDREVQKYMTIVNNGTVSLSNPLHISTMYTAIMYRADSLSKLELSLYKPEGKDMVEAVNHPLYWMLKEPNTFQTQKDFIAGVEQNRLSNGNQLVKINRYNTGVIKNFQQLFPLSVEYRLVNGELIWNIDGVKYNNWEIMHFKMPVTEDGVWGITPINALRVNLDTTYKAYQTIANAYDNNMFTQRALEANLTSVNQVEEAKKLQKEWVDNYGGSQNAWKTIVVPPFFKLNTMQLNLKDAEFLGTVNFNQGQILGLYGLPAELFNNNNQSKLNLEEILINYKLSTIYPTVIHYQQQMENKLLTTKEKKEGYRIKFNLDGLVEADYSKKIDGAVKLVNAAIASREEVAQKFGYKTFKNADKHLIQMQNMAAIEEYDEISDYFKPQANGSAETEDSSTKTEEKNNSKENIEENEK
jgi:HK97 family phage portal protein